MYKGFNRTVGTVSGAGLALGVHWVASKSGKTLEPAVASGSVFLLGTSREMDQHGSVINNCLIKRHACVYVQQLQRRSRGSYRR